MLAFAVEHVDPVVAYWTTSGGLVFVTILAGPLTVWGAFVGALVFEVARSAAVALLPGAWQLILGAVLLFTILFIPDGVGSLLLKRNPSRRDRR